MKARKMVAKTLHGNAEGAGFAGAGGGNGNHVVAFHHDGDGLFLHRGDAGKAHGGYRLHNFFGKIQALKACHFFFGFQNKISFLGSKSANKRTSLAV